MKVLTLTTNGVLTFLLTPVHPLWDINLFPFRLVLRSMLCLTPCEFYLTELSHDSSAPGVFWPTRFPFTRWCPAQGNLRGTSLIHSQYVAQPSDSSAFDFYDNALATSFFCKGPHLRSYLARRCDSFFRDNHCGRTQVSDLMTRQHSDRQDRLHICLPMVKCSRKVSLRVTMVREAD